MRSQVREILRKMEDHCAPLVSSPSRTTHGGLDDKDVFDDGKLTLCEVLVLKRVLTKLDEKITNDHYQTVYSARNARLISEEEFSTLYVELDKPRNLPMPELPDRELTLREKGRTLNIVLNAMKEFGLVDSPSSVCTELEVPKGNGMDTDTIRVPDSAIGRRLAALYKELESLRNAVTPMIAKDKTPLRSYWTTQNQWFKEHTRSCHSCGSICDVSTYNWESISEKPQ